MGYLKSETQGEIDDFLSDLDESQVEIFKSLLGSENDLQSMFNAMRKMQSKEYNAGGAVDSDGSSKININITLNMGKSSEMNPLDDGNQRDIM